MVGQYHSITRSSTVVVVQLYKGRTRCTKPVVGGLLIPADHLHVRCTPTGPGVRADEQTKSIRMIVIARNRYVHCYA